MLSPTLSPEMKQKVGGDVRELIVEVARR
jgi:hypothetical protein